MKTETYKVQVEHTDTFVGEANYGWVNRAELDIPLGCSSREIVRRAKAELGLTGVKCRREEWGEVIVLRLVHACQIVFITPVY